MPCVFCGGKKAAEKLKNMVWHQWFFWAVCSPKSAICVTRQNAEKYGQEQQDAVLAIKKKLFYLDSRETVEEAKSIVVEVVSVCEKGGFNFLKLNSN